MVAYRLHTAQHYQTTVFSGLSVTLRHRLQLQRLSYHGGRITRTETAAPQQTAMIRPKRDKERRRKHREQSVGGYLVKGAGRGAPLLSAKYLHCTGQSQPGINRIGART